MAERDVLVVGSGHNALVAACYLARAGLDVEVVERDSVAGGAVSTVERFPGIRMDRGSSAHIMVRHTGIIEDLRLAEHGLQYVDMDPWGFAPGADGTEITFWSDVERTGASIADACGDQDAAAYRRFVADWLPRNRVIFDFFQSAPTLPRLGRTILSLARQSRGRVPTVVRELLGSADAVLDSYFASERLKSALAWMAAQSGPPSHEPATADMLGWLTMMHDVPPGRPIGGSGMLTAALARRLASDGGQLTLGDGASAVDQRDGFLTVTLDSGREVRARRVLSGAHVWTTAELIAGSHPRVAERLRTQTRTGNGIGMVLRIATTAPPAYAGDTEGVAHRAMALLCDDRTELRRNYGEFLAGRAPSNPAALVMCPTVDDATLAPRGIHTVTVWGQWHAFTLQEEQWGAVKEREAAKLIEVVERHAPGFRDSIAHCHIQSPADIEAEIGLHHANVMHLEMTLDQMFSLRPTPVDSGYRVDGAPGLYLTGASTHPGGGVFGASGRSAAEAILADERLPHRRGGRLRGHLRGLAHHRIARREGGREWPHQQLHRVVPRGDHQHHAQGLAHDPGLARSQDRRHLGAFRRHPGRKLALDLLDLPRGDPQVRGPGLERWPAEVGSERGDELVLALDEHPLQGGELLLAPLQGSQAAAGVRRPQPIEQQG